MWIKKYMDFANMGTMFNFLVGFSALLLALQGKVKISILLITVCFVIDHIDGAIARKYNPHATDKRDFGKMLDMFSDFFAFSIVVIINILVLTQMSFLGILVSSLFLISSILRLIRFDIEPQEQNNIYDGLPTPYSAYIIGIAILFYDEYNFDISLLYVLVLLISYLQVSNFKLTKPNIYITVFVMPVVVLLIIFYLQWT